MLAALFVRFFAPGAQSAPSGGWRVFDWEERRRRLEDAYADALEQGELPQPIAAIVAPFKDGPRVDFDRFAKDYDAAMRFLAWHRDEEDFAVILMALLAE